MILQILINFILVQHKAKQRKICLEELFCGSFISREGLPYYCLSCIFNPLCFPRSYVLVLDCIKRRKNYMNIFACHLITPTIFLPPWNSIIYLLCIFDILRIYWWLWVSSKNICSFLLRPWGQRILQYTFIHIQDNLNNKERLLHQQEISMDYRCLR